MTPSSATSTRILPAPPRTSSRVLGLVLVIALGLGSTMVLDRLTRAPAHVEHLTVTNDSDYSLRVTATRPGRSDTVPVGLVAKRSTVQLDDVLDQGGTWRFTFHGQGVDGGSLELARADLERAGWRLTVPGSVATTLHAAGAPPSP